MRMKSVQLGPEMRRDRCASALLILATGSLTFVVGCVGEIGSIGSSEATVLSNGPVTINYATPRLTNVQYVNTLQDLFPNVTLPGLSLPTENVTDGFTNASSGQTVTSVLVSDYQSSAEAIAQALSSNPSGFLSCQPTTTADENACAQSFIAQFGKSAYRRPLTADESTRMLAFYQLDRASDDFPTAMAAVVQVFLQSPSFVYRLEAGTGAQNGGLVPLTSYEVASRLSYFLTNSMPDATLLQAADADALQTPDQVEAQARRLFLTPRARATAAAVNYQWLNLVKVESLSKDATAFPSFTPAIGQALHDSTVMFVDYAFWTQDSLSALLTDSHAFVNDSLAPLYGLQPVGSADLQLVAVDPTQRAGILTQAGLLAGLANTVNDSPVQRGLLVLKSFLCAPPPPPPAGVSTTPPAFDPSTPMTTRQRMATEHALGSCAACHTQMDSIGFAFENYDALGQWRTQDNGLAVDASSSLSGTDVDASFVGAVSLAQKLSQSQDVAQCVSYQWLRYALGLDTSQINLAAASAIAGTFQAADGAFSELLVAITRSDYFRSIAVSK
jgi:uncharacterized protein DUF1592/uncharacterized protein DUF1588/uncharacterized protein DUF1595/uncharacterized protein DUF1587/uncharacterized protein DUF1585